MLPGDVIEYPEHLVGYVEDRTDDGGRLIRFESPRPLNAVIDEVGNIPLPPYIKQELKVPESAPNCLRIQTGFCCGTYRRPSFHT